MAKKIVDNAKKIQKEKRNNLEKELVNFPYKFRKDGSCEMYKNGCMVYENRPMVCNVEKTFNKYFKINLSKHAYYKHNNNLCNTWIKEYNLDKKYLIE